MYSIALKIVLHNDASDVFSFQEHCSMKDLADLAAEGGGTARLGDIVSEGLNRVRIGIHSDFYPINFHTAGIDRYQKCVERDLVQLATTVHARGIHILLQ